MLDGKPREIVGVLPQHFHFLDEGEPAIFLPFKWDRSKVKLGNFSYRALARLKPGVTMSQASADVARMILWRLTGLMVGYPKDVARGVALDQIDRPAQANAVEDQCFVPGALGVAMGIRWKAKPEFEVDGNPLGLGCRALLQPAAQVCAQAFYFASPDAWDGGRQVFFKPCGDAIQNLVAEIQRTG
jgi:hypothetical protein